jgi:hypothetical protein
MQVELERGWGWGQVGWLRQGSERYRFAFCGGASCMVRLVEMYGADFV